MTGPIAICACTFRRPEGLRRLLDGLAEQRFSREPAPPLSVVIADNEGSDTARSLCEAFARRTAIPVAYTVEPRRGIPFARNACLDRLPAESEFFAMIDDDEIPEPDWLDALLRVQQATGADVVQGAVVPEFPAATPAWVRDGGFFGWPSQPLAAAPEPLRDQQAIPSAATNNVLVRTQTVRKIGLRFDPRVGLRGWDDAVFFRTLRAHGARLVFAAEARVREIVPTERTTLRYLARVQYRQGHKKLSMKLLAGHAEDRRVARARLRLRTTLRGAAAIGVGTFELMRGSMQLLWRRDGSERRRVLGVLRIANGAGMVASAAGMSFEHYRGSVLGGGSEA